MSGDLDSIRAAIAKWEALPGPCVGDCCVLKNGVEYRIALVDGDGNVRLAQQQAKFAAGPDGVFYDGNGTLRRPPIPVRKKQPERVPRAVKLVTNPVTYDNLSCRVFEEA